MTYAPRRRTPEQIIGHDALMQLTFEGFAVCRTDRIETLEGVLKAIRRGCDGYAPLANAALADEAKP